MDRLTFKESPRDGFVQKPSMERTRAQEGLSPPGIGDGITSGPAGRQTWDVVGIGGGACRKLLSRLRRHGAAEAGCRACQNTGNVRSTAGGNRPSAKEYDQQQGNNQRPNRCSDRRVSPSISTHSGNIVLLCPISRHVSDSRCGRSGMRVLSAWAACRLDRARAALLRHSDRLCWKTWSHASAHGGLRYPNARTSSYQTDNGE